MTKRRWIKETLGTVIWGFVDSGHPWSLLNKPE